MGAFTTKFITNYSFAKLGRSIDKIARELVDTTGESYENIMKKRIDNKLTPPLRPMTLEMRKKGIGWGGKKVPPTSDDTPLKQTGSLYKSLAYIKSDQTIKMLAYGKSHHDGFPNPYASRRDIPARKFLVGELGDTLTKQLNKTRMKLIMPKIKKAFKTK